MTAVKVLNEKDLSHLFESHYSNLVGYAKSYIGQYETSRDIVMEAFIILWTKRVDFTNKASAHAFLMKCIKNKCLNHLKRAKVAQAMLDNMQTVDVEEDQSVIISRKEAEASFFYSLHSAIDRLPGQCKRVMTFFLEGESTQNIALRMNVSIKTVHNTRLRAVKLLRKHFCKNVIMLTLLEVALKYLKLI